MLVDKKNALKTRVYFRLQFVLSITGEYKSTKLLDKRCWSKKLYTLSLLSIITLPHIYVLESEVLVHKMSSAS